MISRQLISRVGGLSLAQPKLFGLSTKSKSIFELTTVRCLNNQASVDREIPDSLRGYNLLRSKIEYPKIEISSIPQKNYDPYRSKRCGVLAIKKGMTCLWDNLGHQVPCTVLQIQDCQVIQAKTTEKEGYNALQVGSVNVPQRKTPVPLLGHFIANGVEPKHRLIEFRVSADALLPVGTTLSSAHFVPGQFVDAQAPSKGKGFQGGMKRHGFKGLRASHGVSLTHRSIGSTGQRAQPGKVFKGKKMPGRMGGNNVTVQNSQVIKIDTELNLVYLKGCVPGHIEQYVVLTDAVKKWGMAKFGAPKTEAYTPSETHQPPFPTIDPAQLSTLPREIMARLKEPPVDKSKGKK